MFVYRRQTPPRLSPSVPVTLLGPPGTRATAEVSCLVAAAGVSLAFAHTTIGINVEPSAPLKNAFANATVNISVNANGRDANSPGATVTVAANASAHGRAVIGASALTAWTMQAGNGDVLIEASTASVSVSASALAGQTRQANIAVSINVVAIAFAIAPDTDGEANSTVAAIIEAMGVVPGVANVTVTVSGAASEGTTIGEPREATIAIACQAHATFLGPASAFAQSSVEASASAKGTRITGAEVGRNAPAGRSVDWRALVEGTAQEVPDYEFGHKPTKRKFFQR